MLARLMADNEVLGIECPFWELNTGLLALLTVESDHVDILGPAVAISCMLARLVAGVECPSWELNTELLALLAVESETLDVLFPPFNLSTEPCGLASKLRFDLLKSSPRDPSRGEVSSDLADVLPRADGAGTAG
ncbi:hypothetical protein C6558_32140 [Ensifer sp. NM-2]|nr:hypothetical protein C6558_32140 [Ensifer sp. NM-2]